MKLQNRFWNFDLFTRLPLTASPTSRLPAPRLRRRRTPPAPPGRPRVAPRPKPPSSAHGLPPGRPLWLHGREARVPDPLEGRHDLPHHATLLASRHDAVATFRPRPSRFDLPRSPKPSPLSVLPYKLEPQADVTGETSVPCPPRQSCRRAELVADRPPQPHIAQTGNTTTLPDLHRSSTTRLPSPTAS